MFLFEISKTLISILFYLNIERKENFSIFVKNSTKFFGAFLHNERNNANKAIAPIDPTSHITQESGLQILQGLCSLHPGSYG